jgi:G1/S-specific cyclin PLC1
MPFLPDYIQDRITHDMISSITQIASSISQCLSSYDSSPESLPSLHEFISRLYHKSHVPATTFLATAIYLQSVKKVLLQRMPSGIQSTCHRIFLAALVVASKVLDEDAPGNIEWVRYAGGIFTLTELNLMERQLLSLLDWDVRIKEEDVTKYIPRMDRREDSSEVTVRRELLRERRSGGMSRTLIRRIKDARILIEVTEREVEYIM